MSWLKSDNMTGMPITFSKDDRCGTVQDHAAELYSIIKNQRVNIVAHSQGGLDARWYISHYPTNKVANLIMIATPNAGTTAAYIDLTSCAFQGSAGLVDLQPDSKATQSVDRRDITHYYAIAGNYPVPCYFVIQRICYDTDGLVTVDSATDKGNSNYTLLGVFPYNHAELLTHKEIYEKVKDKIR